MALTLTGLTGEGSQSLGGTVLVTDYIVGVTTIPPTLNIIGSIRPRSLRYAGGTGLGWDNSSPLNPDYAGNQPLPNFWHPILLELEDVTWTPGGPITYCDTFFWRLKIGIEITVMIFW